MQIGRLVHRFRLWIVAAVVIAVVGGLLADSMQRLHQRLLSGRMSDLEQRVQQAYVQIDNFYRLAINGDISEQEARQAAMDTVRRLGHGQEEYFWIIDRQGRLIMHTTRPSLEGQSLQGLKSFEGMQLFDKVDAVLRGSGAGFFEYQWPRADTDELLDKIGYIKRFAPWKWGVGSGVYTDDVDLIFWKEVSSLLEVCAVLLAVLVIFWFGFEKTLFADLGSGRRLSRRDER